MVRIAQAVVRHARHKPVESFVTLSGSSTVLLHRAPPLPRCVPNPRDYVRNIRVPRELLKREVVWVQFRPGSNQTCMKDRGEFSATHGGMPGYSRSACPRDSTRPPWSGTRCRVRRVVCPAAGSCRLYDRLRAIDRLVPPNEAGQAPKTRLEGSVHCSPEPLGVAALEPGKHDDLFELVTIPLDPSEHRKSLLLRTVTHVQHGATQHRHPQNLFGALGL